VLIYRCRCYRSATRKLVGDRVHASVEQRMKSLVYSTDTQLHKLHISLNVLYIMRIWDIVQLCLICALASTLKY
jgi:putative ribosome biogenesis GTPase RsgA